MTWTPTDKEVELLTTAVSDKRYEYFIHKVADQEQVWSLRDAEGWRVVADSLDRECVPLWPHKAYAELYATDVFAGSHPEPIPLDTFMTKWLPGMAQDGRFAAVFPTPSNKGVVVAPMELHLHLAAQMEKYK